VTFLISAKDDVLQVPAHALHGDSGHKSVLVSARTAFRANRRWKPGSAMAARLR